ncbi:hypothetical protein NC651_028179 [Populus alba x Populus x berolinensis]|nr:hypothetical protein NC651_028179 [Populus alba x Populus x berolinensis]
MTILCNLLNLNMYQATNLHDLKSVDIISRTTKARYPNKPRIATANWLIVESEWKSYGWTMLLTVLCFLERFVMASSMTYKDQHQQANYREIHFQRHRGKDFNDLANLILLGSFMLFPCGVFMLWCEVARKIKAQICHVSKSSKIRDKLQSKLQHEKQDSIPRENTQLTRRKNGKEEKLNSRNDNHSYHFENQKNKVQIFILRVIEQTQDHSHSTLPACRVRKEILWLDHPSYTLILGTYR